MKKVFTRLRDTKWLLFVFTLVLTVEGVAVFGIVGAQTAQSYLAAVLPIEIVALTNVERMQVQSPILAESSLLDAAANAKAEDMASKGYFSHVSPDGTEPWVWIRKVGYDYRSAGENLAVRFETSADVVRAWMASPTHRKNIVKDSYTEIGVGVADGMYKGKPATFVVQYFATPAVRQTPAPVLQSAAVGESGQYFSRYFLQAVGASHASTNWVLEGIVAFIVVVVGLTFFIKKDMKTETLFGGAAVAAVALVFIAGNAFVLPKLSSTGVANAFSAQLGVILEEQGASTIIEP